jgi:sigma-B regulation protein RsbU (phosphoserine phosphatase)
VRFGPYREKTRIKLGQGLTGTAAVTKEPILVGDVRKDPRYLALIPETRSELVVPLLHKDRVVGVFDLESSVLDSFNEEHVKVLTPLASQVAVAIENARLYEELRRKDERLGRELGIARRSSGLFPERRRGARVETRPTSSPPARWGRPRLLRFQRAGLGVAVGDVAGKGVPAALYGAFASGTVRARAFEKRPPGDLLARVNRTLRRRGVEGLYCSLMYAIFDFQARKVCLANSGLPYPLRYRASTGTCEEIEVSGLPLGTFDDSRYEEQEIGLEAGDVFVFATDGVTEARNAHEDYGAERLRRLVESLARLPATALGEHILEDLARFTGADAHADDVTLVVVKIP